jgi:N-6 DNA Methylase
VGSVNPLFAKLQQHGIAPEILVHLDSKLTHKHAAYLDLVAGPDCDWVKQGLTVIEDQGNALLYVLPAEALNKYEDKLREWLNVLACRGDARYLAVAHPGRLDFYTLHMRATGEEPQPAHKNVSFDKLHDFLIGTWIEHTSQNPQQKAEQTWLEKLLLRLLSDAATELQKRENQLTPDQVLSLVGRALFTRFIADRGILKNQDVETITESSKAQTWKQLFASAQALAHTCAWLDKTFNGNLLPVLPGSEEYPSVSEYQVFFEQHASTHAILGDVLHSALGGQMQLGWQDIQFQHVPADMLSQVYEEFAHKFQTQNAKNTSIYYTPRHIAQQLINAAFAGSELEDKSRAHVLDPSAGAGVFLVLAYKRLVKERWEKTGQQPKRQELRAILNDQLCGLDINAQSLKFAALSLYLTALELDPDPQPLTDLKFKPLSQRVLWDVDGQEFEGLGSLHTHWTDTFHQRFDMVVGNPPWTKPKDASEGVVKAKIESYTKVVRECAKRAGVPPEIVRKLKADQGNPDPVFVWRSLGWAKPNGMLAFALHAQHMLFQKGASYALRQALLGCVELTGVVNGSELSETDIWPTQDAPFCLWIARNRAPEDDSCFYYLNPYAELALCERQQYRLDPKDAQVVSQGVVQSSSDAFKVLAKGGGLDFEVMRRIQQAAPNETVSSYWKKFSLESRLGFRCNSPKSKKPKCDEGAVDLRGLPMLEKVRAAQQKLLVEVGSLPKFQYTSEQMREGCVRSLYRGPMVLMFESPDSKGTFGFHPTTGVGALLCLEDLAFNYSIYGYSCAGHVQSESLARYLQLLSVSSVLSYFTLMTSSKLGGGERPTLQKADVDQFPFIPLENLKSELKEQIPALSARLLAGEKPWAQINEWARKIYKLSKPDMQVIEDTLRTAWPRNVFANERPTPDQFQTFANAVQGVMQPFADIAEVPLQVQICDTDQASGWAFVKVAFAKEAELSAVLPDDWQTYLAVANQFWTSQVKVYADESKSVVYIGQLARNRYWTQTRARMLAMDLLSNDLEQHGKYAHLAQNKGGH